MADRPDRLAVVALLEGGVEVHDVEPPRPLLLEAFGDGHGVVGVRGLVVGVAAQQAHRAAAAQVDRGDHDHGWATAFTNRSYSWSPASPDFSGWNCVANTFSCATAAANGRPCSVTPTASSPGSGANEWTK